MQESISVYKSLKRNMSLVLAPLRFFLENPAIVKILIITYCSWRKIDIKENGQKKY